MDGSDDPILRGGRDSGSGESVIQRRDFTYSSDSLHRMHFDGGDRTESDQYLRAPVDENRRLSLRGDSSVSSNSPRHSWSTAESLRVTMARLEDEFRNILISLVDSVEADSLLANVGSIFSTFERGDGAEMTGSVSSSRRQTGEFVAEDKEEGIIKEIDLLPIDAVPDLRSIAESMIAAGYARECFQAYSSVRKVAVDQHLCRLGFDKHSIGEVQRLEWEVLDRKIQQWIHAARACVRIVFASERYLCDLIFEGLNPDGNGCDSGGVGPETPFVETVKGSALQLFGFAEAISIGNHSTEKLFRFVQLHETLSELFPDIEAMFLRPNTGFGSLIHLHVTEILSLLAEAVRRSLFHFESAMYTTNPSTRPVPGGAIHPLNRYVMNYIGLICDYKENLTQIIVARPSLTGLNSTDNSGKSSPPLMEVHVPNTENQSPFAAHVILIISILVSHIDRNARLYTDAALGHLFSMNNSNYVVQRSNGMTEVRELIGNEYLRSLSGKFQQAAWKYEEAAWGRVRHCLREEGIYVSRLFSSGVSTSTIRERFKSFNAAFEETEKTQSSWYVPDPQLRDELRKSISEKLLPAYRSFLGRFRSHIEKGKNPKMYIKYSVEDLEKVLSKFFE